MTDCCVSTPRIIFWTDWDATFPRIEAASMSGGGRHIVFRDMEIGAWPNGLTLDHLEKRIVWTDARYTIRPFMLPTEAVTSFRSFHTCDIIARRSHHSMIKNISHLFCSPNGH